MHHNAEACACRAYLAVLQAYKAEVVLLMGSVPLALTQILGEYTAALETVHAQAWYSTLCGCPVLYFVLQLEAVSLGST